MTRGRVLIAEDDPSVRSLVQVILQREGFEVETACNGSEAIASLGSKEFDAIVLDLMMVPVGGVGVLEHMVAHQPSALEHTVVLSAAHPRFVEGVVEGKPCRYVPKPFDIADLVTAVESCSVSMGQPKADQG